VMICLCLVTCAVRRHQRFRRCPQLWKVVQMTSRSFVPSGAVARLSGYSVTTRLDVEPSLTVGLLPPGYFRVSASRRKRDQVAGRSVVGLRRR
jgi:hypothetical protein